MLLAVDVGNTNITFAVFNDKDLVASWRISTHGTTTGDEYASFLRGFLADKGLAFADITGVVVSNVVPSIGDGLTWMCRNHFKNAGEPVFLRPESVKGMKIDYHPVTDVGADRIANAISAYEEYKTSLIIVDFGTATTLDAVSEDGVYLGGAISPGIRISVDSLLQKAAKLSGVALTPPERAIGKSTAESLRSGIVCGYAGQVDALVRRFKKEMGTEPKVIATGGMAPLIARYSETIEICDDLITLKGLRIVYERLTK